MRIHVGSDHAGFELKNAICEHLRAAGHEVIDHGALAVRRRDDYPPFCIAAAAADGRGRRAAWASSSAARATASRSPRTRSPGVRAALAWSVETARAGPPAQRRQRHGHRRADARRGDGADPGRHVRRHRVLRRVRGTYAASRCWRSTSPTDPELAPAGRGAGATTRWSSLWRSGRVVVSTSSTSEVRGSQPRGGRACRDPRPVVVSTSSTSELRGSQPRGGRACRDPGRSWSRQARPARWGVVPTGSTRECLGAFQALSGPACGPGGPRRCARPRPGRRRWAVTRRGRASHRPRRRGRVRGLPAGPGRGRRGARPDRIRRVLAAPSCPDRTRTRLLSRATP